MLGAVGQTTLNLPSHDLVVARTGHSKGEGPGSASFVGALALLMEAVPGKRSHRSITMDLSRRRVLHLAASAAVLPVLSRFGWAQTYPSRPVHIIVGLAAGGGADIVARLMGQWLSERFGQQFVIDNRPGAGTNIATETAVRASPDGYTLLMVLPPNTINAALYQKLNFDFIRDIAPVAAIVRTPLAMEINPLLPVKTVPEFIAFAKTNPSGISMASAGIGTSGHVAGELFRMMAHVDMVHVPYRGGAPAITDLLGGQVQVLFDPISSSTEYIKAGKLRALAVTTRTRSEIFPDIPAMAEFVPDYEASAFFGIGVAKNTPVEIIERLNREINAGLADPKLKARFADLGGAVLPGSPADFAKLLAEETTKWGKVVKFAGIKAN
jgi:tripartite-type tricarboxylate transporter receptor subunit TctC